MAGPYLTNTTSQPHRVLLEKLRGLGIPLVAEELFMPAVAARQFLLKHKLAPFLLVAPALREDFADLPRGRRKRWWSVMPGRASPIRP